LPPFLTESSTFGVNFAKLVRRRAALLPYSTGC
jgi:hypothetical protein